MAVPAPTSITVMPAKGRRPEVTSAQNPDVDEALARLIARRYNYELYRNYYDGRHRLAFASEKFLNTFGRLFQTFADNLCPAVVDAVADRLSIRSFGSRKGGRTAAKAAQTIWEDNKMIRRSGEVHQDCLKLGDSYVMVWPHPRTGDAYIWPQRGDLITAKYDEEIYDELLWAAKFWVYQGYIRLNMYYDDRIEKYITKSKTTTLPQKRTAFTEFIEDTKGTVEVWPLPNPYGRVPIFHFTNNAPCGAWGVSELRDAVPLQDALNKSVIDMLVAMEFQSFPQRFATGIAVETDPITGKPIIPWQPGADRIWTVEAPDAKFGEFRATDITQFLKVSEDARLEIARVTGTPLHYIHMTANPPSGEALQAMEERFIKKVGDRQITYGDTWEDVVEFAMYINTGKEIEVCAEWDDPAPHSALQQSQVQLNKKMLGVSQKQLLAEMGYTEEQYNQFLEDRKAEAEVNAVIQESSMPALPASTQQMPEGKPAPDATGATNNTKQENARLNVGRQAKAQ